MFSRSLLIVLLSHCLTAISRSNAADTPSPPAHPPLSVALFDVDATPPIGTMMAYDPVTNKWDLSLRARGLVLLGAGDPIVLCAVDWIGIANEGYDTFRTGLAKAAGTTPSRVALHSLHQHDAPDCDFSAEKILLDSGLNAFQFQSSFQKHVLQQLEETIHNSLLKPQPVTHLGLGTARVDRVASNRRLLGPDGKVRAVRYTSCPDAALRAEPEGTIDPVLSLVSFWNGDRPLAVLSYYATHPQSYYRTGIPNPDFPGVARFLQQLRVPAALHIHFNGAGGNIGAGKYNDGSHQNRRLLAERLADGMRRAWENSERYPIAPGMVAWNIEPVRLGPSKDLDESKLLTEMKRNTPLSAASASRLAWLRRCQSGHPIEVGCLRIGRARILHLPGELFVEYQLAAKAERPDLFIAVAAYGDYGPWYIGTAIAYEQGGYETTPPASNVGPAAEKELLRAIHQLLKD